MFLKLMNQFCDAAFELKTSYFLRSMITHFHFEQFSAK
jgi:hypothetical protein